MTFCFYLGTHQPGWLNQTSVPLFISAPRLRPYKKYPVALGPWALDSGGFSEISLHGMWKTTPEVYSKEVARFSSEIGRLQWAAIQDWMCEDVMLRKTGKSVAEHQKLTVESYDTLLNLNPSISWVPVLQGYTLDDYLRCWELYEARGHNLLNLKQVGVGTMCRRQGTVEATSILSALSKRGLQIHAFGVKKLGLPLLAPFITSSDSMAWSFRARRGQILLPGCETKHKTCANCLRWALAWRDELLGKLAR